MILVSVQGKSTSIQVNIINIAGIEHKVCFACCSCEPIAITLARAELWPATPTNPRFAYTFSLLNWIEALMLECQVSLKDFCNSLKFKCPFSIPQRRDVYSALIDSFEEYRYVTCTLTFVLCMMHLFYT